MSPFDLGFQPVETATSIRVFGRRRPLRCVRVKWTDADDGIYDDALVVHDGKQAFEDRYSMSRDSATTHTTRTTQNRERVYGSERDEHDANIRDIQDNVDLCWRNIWQ